jgi:cytidine deaminase
MSEPASPTVDWPALRAAARAAAAHSYSPYSGFAVGAAAFTEDGRLIVGANIENASYGLTMCAENSLVAAHQMGGGGGLVAITVVGNGAPVTPCGRCRQLLWEFGGPDCLVDVDGVPTRLALLLPSAFPDASTFRSPTHGGT